MRNKVVVRQLVGKFLAIALATALCTAWHTSANAQSGPDAARDAIDRGDLAAARTILDAGLTQSPNDPQLLLQRGRLLLQSADYAGAEAVATRLLNLGPGNAAAANLRGAARLNLRNYSDAKTDFDAALAMDPKLWMAFRNRGQANAQLGVDPAVVLSDYDSALRIEPGNPQLLREAGSWCIAKLLGAERCAAFYRELTTRFPEAAPGYLGFAHAYIAHYETLPDKAGLPALVGPYLQKAARLDPKSELPDALYGMMFLKTGQADLAMASLERAQLRNPGNPVTIELIRKARAAGGKAPSPARLANVVPNYTPPKVAAASPKAEAAVAPAAPPSPTAVSQPTPNPSSGDGIALPDGTWLIGRDAEGYRAYKSRFDRIDAISGDFSTKYATLAVKERCLLIKDYYQELQLFLLFIDAQNREQWGREYREFLSSERVYFSKVRLDLSPSYGGCLRLS